MSFSSGLKGTLKVTVIVHQKWTFKARGIIDMIIATNFATFLGNKSLHFKFIYNILYLLLAYLDLLGLLDHSNDN